MGIDITDKLMVGASYGELEHFFKQKIEEHIDDDHSYGTYDVVEEYFEYISPYYDSDPSDWFIGFAVPNYQEPTAEWFEIVQETAHQFEILTGVKPRLKGGAHVY